MYCTNLSASDFYQAIVTNTDMTSAYIANAIFVGADLSSNVCLTGAVFSKSDLSYADLSNITLLSTNFTNACLKVANLKDTKVDNSLFVNTDIRGANISNVDLVLLLLEVLSTMMRRYGKIQHSLIISYLLFV